MGTRLINWDVPQQVVRKILDHDSCEVTAHYAWLHDTTVRRHWEEGPQGQHQQFVTLNRGGPFAEAAWAKRACPRVLDTGDGWILMVLENRSPWG
ncbi:hypothetical protein [Streptomyces syringium]|uniref:hypothetical protein n=1 Tax=Streptomyces syringium TaxID=76729 RepID=UPI00342CF9B9